MISSGNRGLVVFPFTSASAVPAVNLVPFVLWLRGHAGPFINEMTVMGGSDGQTDSDRFGCGVAWLSTFPLNSNVLRNFYDVGHDRDASTV